MPQVFKREWKTKDGKTQTSNSYYARFQIAGKDVVRSTGQTQKPAAEVVMREMMGELKNGDGIRLHFKRLEYALNRLPQPEQSKHRRKIASRLLGGIEQKLAMNKVWPVWLKSPNKRKPGPKTLKNYAGRWKRFEEWAAGNGIEYLHQVTPAQAQEYAADLMQSGCSMSTYNTHLALLRGLFKTLRLVAGIEDNPWMDDLKQESTPESRRNLTTEELQTVCAAATGVLRYLFALGLYTGMRLGDCVCLRWDAVDFKAGIITVMPMKTRRKKKVIRIPLHPVLAEMLHELREKSPGELLFPEERELYLKDPSNLSKWIQKFFTGCEIQTQKTGTGKTEEYKKALKAWIKGGRKGDKPTYTRAVVEVGFHSLRHSFVSLCAANRVPQVAVMELVGHGSPAMNRLYSHAGDEQKIKAIAALPAIDFEG